MARAQSTRRRIGVLIGIAILKGTCALPRSAGLFAGKWIGLITYLTSKRRRHICETNLRLAFPENDWRRNDQLCRRVFIENGRGLIETGWAWWSKPERFWSDMEVVGLEHLQNARATGRGVILIGGHYSALDLGGLLFAGLSDRFAATYRPHNIQLLEDEILVGRGRFMDLIDRDNVRGLFRALSAGQTVWFAPDQDLGRDRSVFAPFFGVNAATNAGLQKLAKRGAVPLVIGFHRNAEGKYIVRFAPWDANAAEQAPVDFANSMNRLLETMIRLEPAQYMWMHRRFKTRPEGEEYLYTSVRR